MTEQNKLRRFVMASTSSTCEPVRYPFRAPLCVSYWNQRAVRTLAGPGSLTHNSNADARARRFLTNKGSKITKHWPSSPSGGRISKASLQSRLCGTATNAGRQFRMRSSRSHSVAAGAVEPAPSGPLQAEQVPANQGMFGVFTRLSNSPPRNDELRPRSTDDLTWERLEIAPPLGQDLEIAVIEGNLIHRVAFPCRRVFGGWISANAREHVAVQPTHWRIWPGS